MSKQMVGTGCSRGGGRWEGPGLQLLTCLRTGSGPQGARTPDPHLGIGDRLTTREDSRLQPGAPARLTSKRG